MVTYYESSNIGQNVLSKGGKVIKKTFSYLALPYKFVDELIKMTLCMLIDFG
jgi:hypothetical protein